VQVERFVDVVDRAGCLKEASERPRKATGRVEHPVIERVAQPAAHRRHEVDLFGDIRARRGAKPREVVGGEPIQE
jgi:hypothetical protein